MAIIHGKSMAFVTGELFPPCTVSTVRQIWDVASTVTFDCLGNQWTVACHGRVAADLGAASAKQAVMGSMMGSMMMVHDGVNFGLMIVVNNHG